MKSNWTNGALAALAFAALTPAAALAQDREEVAERANEIAAQAGELANDVAITQAAEDEVLNAGVDDTVADRDDDDGFDWGLLGLLGLAGLAGLRKKDDHVHVDTTRRDNNNRL